MDNKTIIEFLIKIELFRGLEKEEFETVAQNIITRDFAPKAILFSENRPREYIFMIYKGEVELFKKTPTGAEIILSIFGAFDFLGEGSLTDDSPHSTSARARIKTEVFCLHKNFFAANGPITLKIFSNIARIISRRMRQTNARAVSSSAQYESGRTRRELVENSIGLVTALVPYIGYEESGRIAAEALQFGHSVYDLVLEKNLMSKKELDKVLMPENMITPRTLI